MAAIPLPQRRFSDIESCNTGRRNLQPTDALFPVTRGSRPAMVTETYTATTLCMGVQRGLWTGTWLQL